MTTNLEAFSLIYLANIIVAAGCCLYVLIQSPRNEANRVTCLHLLAVALTCYCVFLWRMSRSSAASEFWLRCVMMFLVLLPVTFLHEVLVLFRIKSWKFFLKASYVWSVLLALSNITPYLIHRQTGSHTLIVGPA